MNIKTSGLIVWLMGLALIAAFCVMVADRFDNQNVLVLDGVVAAVVYTVALFNFTSWMRPSEEFAQGVPSVGVNIYVATTYVVLAVLGVVIGLVAPLSFKWQLLLQACFAFVLVAGTMTGFFANERLSTVAEKSRLNHLATDQLKQQAQQLKLQTLGLQDADVKEALAKLVERVGYISPSQSAMAQQLEEKLSASLRHIATMGTDDKGALLQEIDQAQAILKQRMATY